MDSLTLVEAYVAAWNAFQKTKLITAVQNEKSLELLANFEDGIEVRSREIRASELRKFVLSKSDDLYLINVHDAVVELGKIPLSLDSKSTLEEVLDIIQNGNTGPVAIHEGEGQPPTPDSKIVREAIYGGFLHGDLSKRKITSSRNATSVNLAFFGWLSYTESVCEVMYSMCLETLASIGRKDSK